MDPFNDSIKEGVRLLKVKLRQDGFYRVIGEAAENAATDYVNQYETIYDEDEQSKETAGRKDEYIEQFNQKLIAEFSRLLQ